MDHPIRGTSRLLPRLPRDLGYRLPVLVALVVAMVLGMTYLTLTSFQGWRLEPRILPPEVATPEWGPPRPPRAIGPEAVQTRTLVGLLEFHGVLTLMAGATAGLTVVILSLGRAARRRRELGVRTVLGASRFRIVRLLGREGGALAGLGSALGVVLGLGAGRILLASWPARLAIEAEGLSQALLLALALTVLAALLFTVLPLLLAPGEEGLRSALSQGGRASSGRPERFLRNTLVVAQLAASVALLTGAGLLVRRALPPTGGAAGEDPEEVLTARIGHQGLTPDSVQRVAFYRSLLERARELTTVEAESIASPGAWVGLGVVETTVAECGACVQGAMYKPLSAPRVREHAVSPGYFETLGIEVLEGRGFTEDDGLDSALVAVVSRSLALKPHTFEDGDPLGRKIQVGGLRGPWLTIVGVVEDVNPPGLAAARNPPPTLYVSAFQHPPARAELAVRLDASADAEPDLRSLVAEAGLGAWTLEGVSTLDQVLEAHKRPLTWIGGLLLTVGGAAFLLAVYGLYAVTAFHVRLRNRELAIRMALGAGPARVLRLVLGENLTLLATGGVLGVWSGLGVGGVLQDLGVPWFDPAVTGGALLALLAAGLAGSWLPATDAASVEPAVTLARE